MYLVSRGISASHHGHDPAQFLSPFWDLEPTNEVRCHPFVYSTTSKHARTHARIQVPNLVAYVVGGKRRLEGWGQP